MYMKDKKQLDLAYKMHSSSVIFPAYSTIMVL